MKSYETKPLVSEEQVEDETALESDAVIFSASALQEEAVLTEGTTGLSDAEDVVDEGEGLVEQPQRHGFRPPSRDRLLTWIPFWGMILLGAILRFWGLGDKPLHHDESLHAYYSLVLLHNNIQNWAACLNATPGYFCYQYDPLTHGPFQFHAIAFTYQIAQLLGVYDHGVNTFTVRIPAALLGTVIVGLPYFLRDYLGKFGALIASFLLAVSPSLVYFSRFAREDIYMACFTLLMVVSLARYVRNRQMRWLVLGAAAFALSYATKEATFLTIAVFGSFVGGLLAWELGLKWKLWSDRPYLPRTAAPFMLLAYVVVVGVAAKQFFAVLNALSTYITDPQNTTIAALKLQDLETATVGIVPYLGIILGIYVLSILIREMLGKLPPPGRRGLAKRIDPRRQRLLDTILTMPWTHWFFAVLCAWTIFLVLFTVLFTNIKGGIGDGIWRGLYYWLQQQHEARGSQPWYYYLLLIPLYEQIGVVFGIVGIIRCLVRPTRFRLFLVYWFVGNVALYSWAAEKMPWLSIHMTMPMMLLAAIGLEPIVVTLVNWVKQLLAKTKAHESLEIDDRPVLAPLPPRRVGRFAGSTALVGAAMAVLLLLPTLHNMYEVAYVHAADGPHEMLVYVQTTTDVNIVMQKVDALDQKYYGGKHLLPIGVMNDAVWPFVWYLRDYTRVCLYYSTTNTCPELAKTMPVIIGGGDSIAAGVETQYGGTDQQPGSYMYHEYQMRSWWDEGYKPPLCTPSKTNDCAGLLYGYVGVGLWLSYGDNPPPGAKFNLGLAAQHIWQWWWQRRPIGSPDGAYDMVLFIQKGLDVTP